MRTDAWVGAPLLLVGAGLLICSGEEFRDHIERYCFSQVRPKSKFLWANRPLLCFVEILAT